MGCIYRKGLKEKGEERERERESQENTFVCGNEVKKILGRLSEKIIRQGKSEL